MMANLDRSEVEVMVADSQRDAWTGIVPYGVLGEIADRRDVRNVLMPSSEFRYAPLHYRQHTNASTRREPSLQNLKRRQGVDLGVMDQNVL